MKKSVLLFLYCYVMRLFLIVLFSLIFSFGFTQSNNNQFDKKTNKSFKKAKEYYLNKNYSKAEEKLLKILERNPDFFEADILLGDLYLDINKKNAAVAYYNKALKINPDFYPPLNKILANVELSIGMYKNAKQHFIKYLSFEIVQADDAKNIKGKIKQCDFAIFQKEHPVPYHPVSLGNNINSTDDEYINSVSLDEQTLVFTFKERNKSKENIPLKEDLYISEIKDSVWQKPDKFEMPDFMPCNKGAFSLSPDAKYLFFSACYCDDSFGGCDLYYMKKTGDKWSQPINMGENVNTKFWESQPCFSSDGITLYFASNRPGGKGKSDIWKTTLLKNNIWSKPVNLGAAINTDKSEMSPFIHADGRTLYFSSDGHAGMGGMDLFMSKKISDFLWSKPLNLGYPINTYTDEINLVVEASAQKAFISSKKNDNYDIFSFELYDEIKPEKTVFFKGIISDFKTHKHLRAAFELYDLETGKAIVKSYSDPVDGSFLVCLPCNKNYALNVNKDNYLFYSENFNLINCDNVKPFVKNIFLHPFVKGESIVLNNIFFDTDKYLLKKESLVELNKIFEFLSKNKNIKVQINGHTDNVGNFKYNKILSTNRAKSVYNFLIEKGIDKNRLKYKGYSSSKPVESNNTPQGRARNRRTEIEIVEM